MSVRHELTDGEESDSDGEVRSSRLKSSKTKVARKRQKKYLLRNRTEIRRWMNKSEYRSTDLFSRCCRLAAEGVASPKLLSEVARSRGITRWSVESGASKFLWGRRN